MAKFFAFLYVTKIILLEKITTNIVSGSYTYINENNGLTEVPQDISADKENIKLRKNAISQIKAQDFINVTEMTHLYLSRNSIEVFHKFALQYNTKLEELDVSYNQLTFPPPLSGAEQSIVRLDLEENLIGNISADYFTNKTSLEQVFLQKNQLTEISIGKLDSLIKIYIDENNLQVMPHLSHILPSLKTLYLPENNIAFVSHDYFNKTPSLATLNMKYNRLREFPNLMPINGSLVSLYLGHNNMNISYNNPTMMTKLQTLKLSGNYIELSLVDVPELNFLQFTNNGQIKKLTKMPSLLNPLRSLTRLHVTSNWISAISPQYFRNTPGILDLRLSGNDLQNFSTANELNLTYLEIHYNELTSFSCENLKYLSVVRLDNNRLTSFPNLTDCAQELTSLEMERNDIIYDKAYSEFFFSHRNISNTNNIQRFPQMTYLSMSENTVKILDSTFYNDFPKLTTINMEKCQLTTFPNISNLVW